MIFVLLSTNTMHGASISQLGGSDKLGMFPWVSKLMATSMWGSLLTIIPTRKECWMVSWLREKAQNNFSIKLWQVQGIFLCMEFSLRNVRINGLDLLLTLIQQLTAALWAKKKSIVFLDPKKGNSTGFLRKRDLKWLTLPKTEHTHTILLFLTFSTLSLFLKTPTNFLSIMSQLQLGMKRVWSFATTLLTTTFTDLWVILLFPSLTPFSSFFTAGLILHWKRRPGLSGILIEVILSTRMQKTILIT